LQEDWPVIVETDMINRERRLIPVRMTVVPVKDAQGRHAGWLHALEDLRSLQGREGIKPAAYGFGSLVGKSTQMEKLFQILPMLAQSDSSVLITGETGTGKDLVSEAIHNASDRSKGPFVKVNCGALPETLLESELFGHNKGAFTGAVENKPGRFRLAHNGSLYLTEIGDLPLPLQVKLLTFLDDKTVYPLGSTRGFQANVRVIAATHRNLERMVREGRFREDLLFRLNVVRLHIPPVRERGEDIRLLLDHFLHIFAGQFKKSINGFSPGALKILIDYAYPGNVRELKNIVEYAVNVCEGGQILMKNLPSYLTDRGHPERLPHPEAHVETSVSSSLESGGAEGDETWISVERRMIMDALVKAKGRRTRAADILGWARSTLWRKMKQHGLD
jgi:transcriptional regulator with PAS, ATPase and Fis domain